MAARLPEWVADTTTLAFLCEVMRASHSLVRIVLEYAVADIRVALFADKNSSSNKQVRVLNSATTIGCLENFPKNATRIAPLSQLNTMAESSLFTTWLWMSWSGQRVRTTLHTACMDGANGEARTVVRCRMSPR